MKTLIFEYKKLYANKLFFGLLISSIMILITFLFLSYGLKTEDFVNSPTQSEESGGYVVDEFLPLTKDEKMLYYVEEINRLEDILENENLHPSEKENILSRKKKFEFFVSSQKTESEFIDIEDPTTKNTSYQNSAFMFHILNSIYVIVIIFTLLISIYTFALDFQDDTFKNIFASSESRKKILKGKLLFQLSLTLGVVFLFLFIALISGLTQSNTLFLVYANSEYYSINCLTSFCFQSWGLIILILIVMLLSNLIIIFTRNITLTISIPLTIILILIFSFYALDNYFDIKNIKVDAATLIVFLNIIQIFKYIDLSTLYWNFGYIFLILISYYIGMKGFVKLNY